MKVIYPLKDVPSQKEIEELFGQKLSFYQRIRLIRSVGAVKIGAKRPPKKGEWYLSGAIVEAYRALNDLETPYYIAHLIKKTL